MTSVIDETHCRRTVEELWTAVKDYQRESQELALNLVTMAIEDSHLPTMAQLGLLPDGKRKLSRRREKMKTEPKKSSSSCECPVDEEYQIPFACTDRNSPPTTPPPAFPSSSPRVAKNSEYIVLDEYRCTDNIDAPEKSKHQKAQKENPRTKITSFEQMSNMSCNVENGRPLLTYRDGSTGCDIKRFEKELAYEKRRFESHWKRVIQKGEQKISMLEAERRRMEKEARERSQSKNSECSDDSTNTDPNASEVSLTDTFSGSGHSSLWSEDTDFDDFDVCRICAEECISVELATLGICKICFQITFPNVKW